MTVGELPSRPWQIVATDLFHFRGCDYLLLIDYYSRFFETAKLPGITVTLNLFLLDTGSPMYSEVTIVHNLHQMNSNSSEASVESLTYQ